MKQLWLIYFESANYVGYGGYCVVEANSEDEAKEAAYHYVEDYYYQEDSDQYYEDYGDEEEPYAWGEIMKVEVFNEQHDCWEYYNDPSKGQSQFYPKLN